MNTTIADLSPQEFEALISETIDRRMQVWITQLLDAIGGDSENDHADLSDEFSAVLQIALDQAHAGNLTTLNDFRKEFIND